MKAFLPVLILALTWSLPLRAQDGADVPLQPFQVYARQFLEAIVAQDYDRAFEMLQQGDIRIAVAQKQGDPAKLLADKKSRFVEQAKIEAGFAAWALASNIEFQSVRHDSANVTVWVPIKDGRLAVQMMEGLDGRITIRSFATREGPVLLK